MQLIYRNIARFVFGSVALVFTALFGFMVEPYGITGQVLGATWIFASAGLLATMCQPRFLRGTAIPYLMQLTWGGTMVTLSIGSLASKWSACSPMECAISVIALLVGLCVMVFATATTRQLQPRNGA